MTTPTIHGITESEVFRLVCTYVSIRNPGPRREVLNLVERWAHQQWNAAAGDLSLNRGD